MGGKVFILFTFLGIAECVAGQESGADSTVKSISMNEVVITATRSEQKSSRVPVPVTVIQAAELKAAGYVKLTEAISELGGANVVSYFGNGLQLRGLDPAYTLILLDNQPIIGRISGTLDLDRIAIGDIERIEIIRGPSSALYGSEALAGVVNIITKKGKQELESEAGARYGSHGTSQLSGSFSGGMKNFSSRIYVDGFRTDGYDLDKTTPNRSGSKIENGTIQGRASYVFGRKLSAVFNGRYFNDKALNFDRYSDGNAMQDFDLVDRTEEFTVTPSLKYYPGNKSSISIASYWTNFNYHSIANYSKDGMTFYDDVFRQQLIKPELLFDCNPLSWLQVTTGAEYSGEKVSTNRYTGDKYQSTSSLFLQLLASPRSRISISGGLRIDQSSVYGSHYSPKIALQVVPANDIRLLGSWGTGFKSPDFRQLYLNFANPLVGYSVFGTEELASQLEVLETSGQLESMLIQKDEPGSLQPETSGEFDVALEVNRWKKFFFSVAVFRNDISDLIDTRPVAQKTNGQYIYSYTNLHRVFTEGIEISVKFSLNRNFLFSSAYQYLEAKDKQVLEDLAQGKIYARDPESLTSYKVKTSEYGGLFNRSKHSGNLKCSYTNFKYGWNAALRYNYRGPFGFADRNGSGILDAPEEYVSGYGLLNASVSKTILKRWSVQLSLNNLLGYTNPEYIPSLPGRMYLIAINYQFHKLLKPTNQ